MMALKGISLIIGVLVVADQVSDARAWVAQGTYHNDAHPDKCTINARTVIAVGEKVKSPNECAEIVCLSKDGLAELHGCGAIGAPANCFWSSYVDMYAPFPQCCIRELVCDQPKNDENKTFEENIRNMFINAHQTKSL